MSASPCGPSVQQSTWHRLTIGDSSQLIKRGTTSPASYGKLRGEGAALGQLASLEPLQPDGPLCWFSVLEGKPSYGQLPHAHWALALWVSVTQPVACTPSPAWFGETCAHSSTLTKDLGFHFFLAGGGGLLHFSGRPVWGLMLLNHFEKQKLDIQSKPSHILCLSPLHRIITNEQIQNHTGRWGTI